MKIARYHLFPQIGLICLIVGAFGRLSRRLDSRPGRGLLAAVAARGMPGSSAISRDEARGRRAFPVPGSASSARGGGEAGGHCEARGDHVRPVDFWALDPVQPRWAPHPWPFHPILFLFPRGAWDGKRLADSDVRATVIAALTPEERESRLRRDGGDEVPPSHSGREWAGASNHARLVATSRMTRLGAGRYESYDGPAYLEFQVDPAADNARALSLPGLEIRMADRGLVGGTGRTLVARTERLLEARPRAARRHLGGAIRRIASLA